MDLEDGSEAVVISWFVVDVSIACLDCYRVRVLALHPILLLLHPSLGPAMVE